MELKFKLNGSNVAYLINEGDYLAKVLRNNNLTSIKVGCDQSTCGSCTVLLDGRPVLSCSLLAAKVEGREITTVEAIQEEASIISDYFSKEGADQCGFCNSGFALIIHALRKEYKSPSEKEIKAFIVGNLCRCTGYQSQLKAIKAYLEATK